MSSNVTFEELEPSLKEYENYEEIKKAYLYALDNFKGMKRLTGDPFITHPLEVVKILLDLNVDDVTIIAAFLHESIKVGGKTYEEIEEIFGTEVAKIVLSITKINKLELPDNDEKSVVYLRKILVGLAEDVRVIYIKLADRLHNMRTNWATNPKEQKDKATETMKVLVPIAHRLGINSVKSELENLSLYYLKPDVYNDILEKLNDTTKELDGYLTDMKESIIEILNNNGIEFEIKGRVKSVYSIYNKLSNGKKWDNIYDILALRILVNTEVECYQVIGLIHSRFRPMPKRFKDYIASPKENMYQSLHTTVFGRDGKVFEVQVRTHEMDEIAEKGIASHWSYKEKGNKHIQNIMEQKLEMFRNTIELGNLETDDDFESNINSNLFSEYIYVYTPKGDVIELPKGATPIDFAYRIHSNVGDTTVGAIVNDKIVPLSYELDNDDVVSIKTSSLSTPNKDWLSFVKTPQARSKIKAYFSKQEKEEIEKKGKNVIETELRKRKLSFNEVFNNDTLNKIFKDLKLKDINDLYFAVGSLRYTAGYIINLVNNDKKDVMDPLLERKVITPNINYKSDILVEGIPDIKVNIAKCCMPIKGDDIIGFITKGEGVSVHKKSCSNIDMSSKRIIDVSWNNNSSNYYYTNIYVVLNENIDILAELITVIGKSDSLVKTVDRSIINNEFVYTINIRVKNKEDLEKIIKNVRKVKGVRDVTLNTSEI